MTLLSRTCFVICVSRGNRFWNCSVCQNVSLLYKPKTNDILIIFVHYGTGLKQLIFLHHISDFYRINPAIHSLLQADGLSRSYVFYSILYDKHYTHLLPICVLTWSCLGINREFSTDDVTFQRKLLLHDKDSLRKDYACIYCTIFKQFDMYFLQAIISLNLFYTFLLLYFL